MKFTKRLIEFLILLAALCLMAPVVQAADISVVGGIGIAPDYEGSDYYEAVPVPFADVKFGNGMFVKLFGLNLRANLIPSAMWHLGPVYNYRAERDNVDNDAETNGLAAVVPFGLVASLGLSLIPEALHERRFRFLLAIYYGWLGALAGVVTLAFLG